MNVCRYYQTNTCRFGSKCRYEHVKEGNQYNYEYDSRGSGVSVLQREKLNQSVPNPRENVNAKAVADCLNIMSNEVSQIEYGKMWPLTTLGIMKENHCNIPGWEDFSPEELRFLAYKCQREGKFEEYVVYVNRLLEKAKELRTIFMRPNKIAEDTIIQYLKQVSNTEYNSETNSTFSSDFSSNSPFGFSQGTQELQFGQQNPVKSTSVFSLGSNPAFQSQQETNKPTFGVTTNIFGSVNQPGLLPQPPQHNIFGSVQSFSVPTNLFGGTQNIRDTFRNTNDAIQQALIHISPMGNTLNKDTLPKSGENQVYTNISDLTEEEIEQFRARTFSFVPTKPPPRELCQW